MKMPKEQYAFIKDKFSKFTIEDIRNHTQFVIKENKTKNVETRVTFDALYASGLTKYVIERIYPAGLNDNHIETALHRIAKELGWSKIISAEINNANGK